MKLYGLKARGVLQSMESSSSLICSSLFKTEEKAMNHIPRFHKNCVTETGDKFRDLYNLRDDETLNIDIVHFELSEE